MVSTVAAAPDSGARRTSALQDVARDERRVAGKHQQRAGEDLSAAQARRVRYRMLLLQGDQRHPAGEEGSPARARGRAPPPCARRHGRCRIEHVQHHGPATDRVQDLGKVGLHALALAGGQDHDGRDVASEPRPHLVGSRIRKGKLGRQDSNLRMTGPKPVALPLGHAPRAPGSIGGPPKGCQPHERFPPRGGRPRLSGRWPPPWR